MDDKEPKPTIEESLSAPFEEWLVEWKPTVVKQGRALAVAYVDARLVMDRLDEVLGIAGWKDDYEFLADGGVVCRLSVRLPGTNEWVVRVDVGSPSEQPDPHDRVKAAVSDALKRAAVKVGVARYLYKLPLTWVDYDEQKRQIVKVPRLPEWALPKAGPKPPAQPAPAKAAQPAAKPEDIPTTGEALLEWLMRAEAQLQRMGLLRHATELSEYMGKKAKERGLADHLRQWDQDSIRWAYATAMAFGRRRREEAEA